LKILREVWAAKKPLFKKPFWVGFTREMLKDQTTSLQNTFEKL
jgi:hypothetical protein